MEFLKLEFLYFDTSFTISKLCANSYRETEGY